MFRRTCLGALGSLPLLSGASSAFAQDFPARNISFVIPFAAGSQSDAIARWLGNHLSEQLGRPIMVENFPGANGQIAARDFIRRPADGHNVFITTNTTHAANPNLYRSLPYDPTRDFTPVGCLFRLPLVLVARASLPVRSVAELVALARSKPGQLTFGWQSSSGRVGGELLKARANIDLLAVPFRSAPQITTELLAGRLDLFVSDPVSALPHVQSGALRALAVTSAGRSSFFPGVPTMMEAGVPDYELTGWYAVFLPAGAPPAVVARLNAAFDQALRSPDFPAFAARTGIEAFTCSPDELARFVTTETERWRQFVEIAGIERE